MKERAWTDKAVNYMVNEFGEPYRITVIVATRNRPEMLRSCVTSLLRCLHPSFEILIVDQSDEPAHLPADLRISYHWLPGQGKSIALNEALKRTTSPIVVFTDDDCTVPADWLIKGEALLSRLATVSLIFGSLSAIDHDPSKCFVPVANFERLRVVTDPGEAYKRGGAGANMIARRALFHTIGDFDEAIGPGSRFQACEEFDIYYRTLASGFSVAFAPELEVLHWGARPYLDGAGKRLLRGYAYGEGACLGKHIRLRGPSILRVAGQIIISDVRDIARNLAHGRLSGLGTFAYKCRGMFEGTWASVDRGRRVFR